MSAARPIVPVILSGGAGARLWPLSRLDRPKPLTAPVGGESLIRQTARRVADRARFAAPIVVTGEAHSSAVAGELAAAGFAPSPLIVEPAPRGTAAAIALAALEAGPDATILVLPSDHVIADEGAFLDAVNAGREAAETGRLVLFGITPERAETGYGYVRAGAPLAGGAYKVARFAEKPDRVTAETWLAEGGWSWNAGIFLMSAAACLEELARHAPALLERVQASMAGARREGGRVDPDPAAFAAAPSASFDRAVMEKSDRAAIVPVSMGWSDVGSWEALHALGPLDENGNLLAGDVVAPGTTGCLVRSDGPAVVALGVSDLVIVATERAVLVVPRGETQRVQEAIDALEARRRDPQG